MRQFTPYQEGKTWEDWADHMRAHYPVRYFLSEVLPLWVKRRFVWPWQRLRDWVLDHAVPSRRYHLLDLRGIDPLSHYRHGYLDPCDVFWLAGWASLMRWHRESAGVKTQRELDLNLDSTRHKLYCEALELVHYWTVTRAERAKESERLRAIVDEIQTTLENQSRYEAARDEWLEQYQASEKLEEAMWLRLAPLRPLLWD